MKTRRNGMKHTRNLLIGATFLTLLAVLGLAQSTLEKASAAQSNGAVMAPKFEVDPTFPKPLPNGWYQGQTIGVSVDAQDHIWIIHRSDSLDAVEAAADQKPPLGECCKLAPPVLEFDHKGSVWIGGNGGDDGTVTKFTQDGKFIMQIGKRAPTPDSNSMERFWKVAKISEDPRTNEMYVADGYGNKRVAVIDEDTGKFKRIWGAYGNVPDDKADLGRYTNGSKPAPQFRGPVHCADLSVDNLVYVCDRTNDRLQVFTREGKFVKEIFVAPESLGDGSTWDTAFSRDPQQRFIYIADGRNQKLRIFDRATLTELTNFGEGGHYPGQFYSMHSIATDSKGNLYTTETYQGRRVQKFVYKGLGPVTKKEQGTVWPTR